MRTLSVLSGALLALALSTAPSSAQGSWQVAYPEARDTMHALMRQMFLQQDALASLVQPLNEYFPVPRATTVEIAECGRPGAFYDAPRPAVQLCYELITDLAQRLMGDDAEGGQDLFTGAFAIVLLHQVGHAMVDLLKLPVTAPLEEAADQFVAVMARYAGSELRTVPDGARALSETGIDWENPGSDRSALSGRRLENLLCLVYGTDPTAHERVVSEGMLPAERAGACPARYREVEAEWMEMLSKHVKH
ncbi:MAG TPA: DUF4344 domain-containing metallopeptidase [Longimicrobiaceae bacterium]|nr:DUF4344 domain-containing metallopeptidase [Longimicrobiaceae bacterium]